MLVSLGLGLSTLASIALIQGNLRVQVLNQLPAQAPTFFFVDIQDAQLEQFKTTAAAQGATRIAEVPSLRARLVSVNGTPADQVQATPDTQWALRGDRGLTYSAMPPEGSRIVAGTWWPADYDGPPLVSFDANLAKGWGVGLGDTLRVNVLGRDIDLKIASLREIAWRSLSLNFTMVASPGLLARAPHTHLATVYADAGHEAGVLRAVTDALPNVSGIRVADVLGAVADNATIDAGLRSYMLRVYNWMTSGLLLTGVVAYAVANTSLISLFYQQVQTARGYAVQPTLLGYAAMFAPRVFVMVLSFGVNRLSTQATQALFWAFAATMGASLANIFLIYNGGSIARVFFITSGTFAAMSIYGYTTKADLSRMGSFLMMGLVGIVIASLVNMFIGSTALQFAISVIGVLVFVGLTAYDTQRIKNDYSQMAYADGVDGAAKRSVFDALSLYLNFINLFMLLLNLFGGRRSE